MVRHGESYNRVGEGGYGSHLHRFRKRGKAIYTVDNDVVRSGDVSSELSPRTVTTPGRGGRRTQQDYPATWSGVAVSPVS